MSKITNEEYKSGVKGRGSDVIDDDNEDDDCDEVICAG